MTDLKINHADLQQFILELLTAAGVARQEAPLIAEILVWFDLIGRSTQGTTRLPAYIKRLQAGLIKSPCQPEFTRHTETVYLVNGHDGFGHYLGHVAMMKAIHISDQCGVGVVGVRRSNHFGAGAYYVQLAAQHHKIGLAVSNSVPLVAPHGGVSPVLGTNPFAFGAPTRSGQAVLVDFSTGANAGSALRKKLREGQTIPEGILIDENGQAVTNPAQVDQSVILPFSGAKGFCLGLMVEILSGVLTGAAISHQIASLHQNFERSSNVGHLFMAIDIAKLMPLAAFFERMELLIGFIKSAKTQPGFDEILIPGETRWRTYARQLEEGIHFRQKDLEPIITLAKELKIRPPW